MHSFAIRLCTLLFFCASLISCKPLGTPVTLQVGPNPHGGHVLPTAQLIHPAGQSIEYKGRPVDLLLALDHKSLYVKDSGGSFPAAKIESSTTIGTWLTPRPRMNRFP